MVKSFLLKIFNKVNQYKSKKEKHDGKSNRQTSTRII